MEKLRQRNETLEELMRNMDETPREPLKISSPKKQEKIVTKKKSFLGEELFRAVTNNEIERVKDLLANKAKVDWMDNDGITPLIVAIRTGFRDIAKLLIEAGIVMKYELHI